MREALALARRMLGRTSPNPAVGCVIVRGGRRGGQIVGQGATAAGGRPHAEAVALARAGAKARGATAYVTLEPCAHQGHTPPCARALVEAGVRRVVVGCIDPYPPVRGRGVAIAARRGSRSRKWRARRRMPPPERWLHHPRDPRTAVCDAEARALARRPNRRRFVAIRNGSVRPRRARWSIDGAVKPTR